MQQFDAATRRGSPINIERITKTFGSVTAVNDVSMEIAAGEFLALLGPSGSGKTSILMGLAGFDLPSSGRITMEGRDVTYLPANRRNLGMVFQKYTLFPHMSVRDNVAFPLKMRGVDKNERRRRADVALETVRLSAFGDRMPAQLSGGQQQRVALARAIVYEPGVLLMDEPLSALDKNLREEMQLEIKRLHAELGVTILFVTHDQSEALHMADRIAVLKDGRIQQIGTPAELYHQPENLFVAGFMGDMNIFPARVRSVDSEGSAELDVAGGATWECKCANKVKAGDSAHIALRPEHMVVVRPDATSSLRASLVDRVFSGPSCLYIARTDSGHDIRVWQATANTDFSLQVGSPIFIAAQPGAGRAYREGA